MHTDAHGSADLLLYQTGRLPKLGCMLECAWWPIRETRRTAGSARKCHLRDPRHSLGLRGLQYRCQLLNNEKLLQTTEADLRLHRVRARIRGQAAGLAVQGGRQQMVAVLEELPRFTCVCFRYCSSHDI